MLSPYYVLKLEEKKKSSVGELGALGDIIFTWARRMDQKIRFESGDSHLRIKVMALCAHINLTPFTQFGQGQN